MKRKLLALTLSALLVPAAGSALAQAAKISGDVVKIAVLTDMSGVYSDLGGKGSVVAACATTPTNGNYNLHDKNHKKESIMLTPFIL